MEKIYTFECIIKQILFDKPLKDTKNYTFSLVNGFVSCGEIDNVIVKQKTSCYQLENYIPLTFMYTYLSENQDDLTIQLTLYDTINCNQIDFHTISALQLIHKFAKKKGTKSVTEKWIVPGQMINQAQIEKIVAQILNLIVLDLTVLNVVYLKVKDSINLIQFRGKKRTLKEMLIPLVGSRFQLEKKIQQKDFLRRSRISKDDHSHPQHNSQNHQIPHSSSSHDEHGQTTHLSIKLKIVVLMLIFGFLFLTYNAFFYSVQSPPTLQKPKKKLIKKKVKIH